MINNVTLVGRLTKDPEIRHLEIGNSVCRFSLAVQRSFTNKNGERDTDFINCVAWGKTAVLVSQYVKKGHKLGVVGRIETGSYEKNGVKTYTTDVVVNQIAFLESQQNANATQQPYQQNLNISQNEMPFNQQPPQQQQYQQQQAPQQQQYQQPQQQQQNFVDNLPPF